MLLIFVPGLDDLREDLDLAQLFQNQRRDLANDTQLEGVDHQDDKEHELELFRCLRPNKAKSFLLRLHDNSSQHPHDTQIERPEGRQLMGPPNVQRLCKQHDEDEPEGEEGEDGSKDVANGTYQSVQVA